ncbi:MAG: DUF4349 domain-containing protein [Dyadobacter sp.]
MADITGINPASSSAAVENKDSNRKFIRTADLKFKVKSVMNATYEIEDLINRNEGFVTFTNLRSTVDNFSITAISPDSSLETTHYTVTNTMTIRVPNIKLDTTLKALARNMDYLDHRVITAEDVSLKLLSNSQSQIRSAENGKRIAKAIDNRGKKLNETIAAENILQNTQEQKDDAIILNLTLTDQIEFSTINIFLYQRQAIGRAVVSNEKNINEYEPGFGRKIIDSLKYGWDMIAALLVYLTKLWGLFILATLAYILYKVSQKKLK